MIHLLNKLRQTQQPSLGAIQTWNGNTAALRENTVEENFNNAGANIVASDDLEIGFFDPDYRPQVGVRFPNATIPQFSATPVTGKVGEITEAYIQFTAKETNSGGVCVVAVFGIDVDNCALFNTTAFDLSNRAKTTATFDWDLSSVAWTLGNKLAAQKTPSLISIVEEILLRAGWASGNAIGFNLGWKTGNTTYRNAASSEHATLDQPEIVIKYKLWL